MRRRPTSERGAALVEMALVLPLLVLLVFGIVDLGRLLFTQIALHEAAQEGSLYASTNPDDPEGARVRVIESIDNPTVELSDVVVDCPGSTVRVSLTYEMDLITPILGGGSVTLDAEVIGDRFATAPCVAAP